MHHHNAKKGCKENWPVQTNEVDSHTCTWVSSWITATPESTKPVDPDMKQTLAWRSNKTRQLAFQEKQGISKATKRLWVQWDRLQLDNGVLYCQWKTKVGNGTRLQSAITRSMLLKVPFAPSKKVVTWSPCSKQDLGAITRMLLLVWPETWCLRLVATVWKVLT